MFVVTAGFSVVEERWTGTGVCAGGLAARGGAAVMVVNGGWAVVVVVVDNCLSLDEVGASCPMIV